MTERERVTTEPESEPRMPDDWDDRAGWNDPRRDDPGLQQITPTQHPARPGDLREAVRSSTRG